MSENVFRIKEKKPTDEMVLEKIGSNFDHLQTIRDHIRETLGDTTEEWKFYGQKHGWTLKKFYKKRNLFFMGVYDGYFQMGFLFGERACQAVMNSGISENLKAELKGARKYAEGRGLRIRVDGPGHLEDIRELIRIKVEN
jgi:hypothetical protein